MAAFYNEIDPYAAQWLRNLIAAGHIAPGVVDERSIQDIRPDELTEYTQCHFFAGIGVWSLALRRAGWPDDRPVWTGSCPCQPFSAAGAGAGFADERHLEPDFAWLIDQCRPAVVFGEQVASKAADAWVDLIQVDLEAMGYAFGAIAFPSAGVGAPHIRDRTYWVANANSRAGRQRSENFRGRVARGDEKPRTRLGSSSGLLVGLGDTCGTGLGQRIGLSGIPGRASRTVQGQATERTSIHAGGMAYANGGNPCPERKQCRGQHGQQPEDAGRLYHHAAGPVNGLWADADWLFCRDGKWRPVEPGTFPLVARPAEGVVRVRADQGHRAGRLRAYGNAINAEAATQFIAAYLDATCINE